MTHPVHVPIFTVYLLHFDQPVGRALHYMGICKTHRLHWRMLDHINGRGSSLTAKAVSQGIGFEVVRTWQTSDPRTERVLKQQGDFKGKCWKCATPLAPERPNIPKTHYVCQPAKSDFKPLDGLTGNRFSRYRP